MFPPFGHVGRVLAKVNRDKTEAVIDTRLVNSILVPGANAYDQSRATLFLAISKKSGSSKQTLQEPSTTSKTPANGNQGNATTVKILEAFLRKSIH